MADESNGEASFEFVEKKPEDFAEAARPVVSEPTTSAAAASSPTTGNFLSGIAPPSALPTFVTAAVTAAQNVLTGQTSPESGRAKPIQPPSELPIGVQTTEPKASDSPDKGPQVLIAPDSPTVDTGALAGSLFSWVKDTVANSNVLSKVAEKAKNSVNSMITTLDPQMREFIYSGGDIEIIVASEKDSKVAPIREAFQNVFGNATVTGSRAVTSFKAAQPVGFAAGIKAAQERIAAIRSNTEIPADIPVVAIENFLLEVGEGKWYDLGVIILEDVKQNINLQTFTQMTPVPSQIVETAKKSTPEDYTTDGLAVTIGSLMGANLQVSHTEWHSALTGVSRKDIIFLAAQSLAGIYKNTINPI